jgi:hypothetical protein
MKKINFLQNKDLPSWLPGALAILGAVLYLIQAVIHAHTSVPGLDEGSYLIKGYLYLRGVYYPFEPYGPLTNKAPFAFLIPGFEQILFGPGLRTGRYFAIFFGLLTLLGTWISARRWSGNWAATGVVWAYALSSMVIKIQATTTSEVIVACMLAWVCVLALGEDRPLWHIVLASMLAALAVLTRQNMAFVLPLLILYVFWQHGKQKGIWAFAAGSVVFLAVHIYYWPNIMTIWAPWLPDSLTPFLDVFRLPKEASPIWDPSIDSWNRTIAFFQGVRYHFIPAVGSIFALFMWAPRRDWKSVPAFRAAVFLAVLYFILFAMHAWAAVASRYESYSCVYCFTPYLTFFDPLGLLLTVIAFTYSWKQNPSRVMLVLCVIASLVIATGIGFSMFDKVGNSLLSIPVPRMRDGQFLPGSTLLMDFLKNKFALSLPLIKRYIASFLGLLAGILVLLFAFLRWRKSGKPYAYLLANSFLIIGLLLAPLLNLGADVDCREDLIAANEQVGQYLAKVIPPDSLVYWDGGLSFTPMVYVVPAARIFPPQINDGYAYRIGGDTDTIYKFGHWNEELNLKWRSEANIFIIEEVRYSYWRLFFETGQFKELQSPPVAPSCNDGAGIRIFQRLP